MSYSIKHTNVMLTTEQFRMIVSALEEIHGTNDLEDARLMANETLDRLKRLDILSEHDYPYGLNTYPQSPGTVTAAPLGEHRA